MGEDRANGSDELRAACRPWYNSLYSKFRSDLAELAGTLSPRLMKRVDYGLSWFLALDGP